MGGRGGGTTGLRRRWPTPSPHHLLPGAATLAAHSAWPQRSGSEGGWARAGALGWWASWVGWVRWEGAAAAPRGCEGGWVGPPTVLCPPATHATLSFLCNALCGGSCHVLRRAGMGASHQGRLCFLSAPAHCCCSWTAATRAVVPMLLSSPDRPPPACRLLAMRCAGWSAQPKCRPCWLGLQCRACAAASPASHACFQTSAVLLLCASLPPIQAGLVVFMSEMQSGVVLRVGPCWSGWLAGPQQGLLLRRQAGGLHRCASVQVAL